MSQVSLYWHDYETFGIDPQRDRPSQFAGVRTDLDLNVIDDPMVIYCKPPADYLPHPEACLLTGITPQLTEAKGIVEAEFSRLIHDQFFQRDTCSLGYNSIRFDDEFTRNCLYRNFFDPYTREWQNGNSRWDLIDVVRATKALRPDGIEWPTDAEDRPSFKLEELTKANGIPHEGAHDALADVIATIALAKLIKAVQPKLYGFLWQHRVKAEAFALLQFGSYKPVVHVSGRYSNINHCLAVVLPICRHPINTNGIIVYDLSIDPEPLISLSSEDIQQRIFTPTLNLPEGIDRIPLKTVHLNKCPVLAPISVLRPEDQQRLHLDLGNCLESINKIKKVTDLPEKIAAVFSSKNVAGSEKKTDPDLAIYSGGFFSDSDKQKITKIRNTPPEQLAKLQFNFADDRLVEMLFRFRARNYPDSLSPEENIQWREHCVNRVNGSQPGGSISLSEFLLLVKKFRSESPDKVDLIVQLEDFAYNKEKQLSLLLT